jgi:phage terminase large subunit
LVEDAIGRDVAPLPFAPVWGLDVARYGDDRTALAVRIGNTMPRPVRWWHGQDLMSTVGKVHDMYREAQARERAGEPNVVPSSILVDSIGIGAGVVDRLRELQLPVRGVNVGETPSANGSRFSRLRDELWWRAREWLEERDCAMVEDAALIGELTSVKYALTSSGKLQVEAKDDMKKRGLRSPDLADAWVLTFAGGLDRRPETWVRERYRYDNRPRKSWRAA